MNEFLQIIKKSLPVKHNITLRSEPDCYGASRIISDNLHLPFKPTSYANWYHGWLSWDPEYVETFGLKSPVKHLVHTLKHEDFLTRRGVRARAIGSPFIYASQLSSIDILRRPNSLLVMPPHSALTSEEDWNEELYIKQILDLKDNFSEVIACISPSCVKKNIWSKTLKKYNIPFLIGADMHDKNALIRMANIFKHFEYVTTNRIGGHVVYAAYSGCKVSIYGDYLDLTEGEFNGDELYIQHPHLIENVIKALSFESIKNRFPFLICDPKHATCQKEWADNQLGECNKKSSLELSILLCWWPHQQIYYLALRFLAKLKRQLGASKN
tara:strand:+ start:1357 stop:2334 length:978 start_codon:yes stop_codon:yes gene_type:complete